MTGRRGKVFSAAILSGLIFLCGGSSGAGGKVFQDKPLRHEAAAVIKLIPVRVLDAEGLPVRDLKREDFLLYDNQKLQAITEFEVHRKEALAPPGPEITASAHPDPVSPANRKYFILLDIQGSDEMGTANAKQSALAFVRTRLRPGDEAAVFSYAPMTGLRLHQYLSTDFDRVIKAITRIKEAPPSPGFISGTEFDDEVRTSGSGRRAGGGGGASSAPPGAGDLLIAVPGLGAFGRKSADFSASMSELAEAVRYIPGSKNVVFFSSRDPGTAAARLFAAANAPVFAINTQNWIVRRVLRWPVKSRFLFDEHPLKEFAEASGGAYFADIKDVENIAEKIDLYSGNYYVLGYYVDEKWDGRFSRITVEVRRPGLRVHVQDGYYNPRPFSERSDIEKRLHLYDLMFADSPDPSVLSLRGEALFSRVPDRADVLFLSRLDVDESIGLPPGPAEIFFLVFDGGDEIVFSERGEVDLTDFKGKTLFFYLAGVFPPGEYRFQAIARDLATGRSLAGRFSFSVPKPDSKGLTIFSPLLLIPGGQPEFLRFSSAVKKAPVVSLLHFFPFLPRDCAPALGEIDFETRRILALVPIHRGNRESGDMELSVTMTSGDGSFPLDWRVLDHKPSAGETDFVLVEVGLPDLSPGDYRIDFSVLDKESGARGSRSADIKIL